MAPIPGISSHHPTPLSWEGEATVCFCFLGLHPILIIVTIAIIAVIIIIILTISPFLQLTGILFMAQRRIVQCKLALPNITHNP